MNSSPSSFSNINSPNPSGNSNSSFYIPSARDITTFPLPPSHKNKLLKAGFKTSAEFTELGPIDLAKDLHITKEEALQILKVIRGEDNSNSVQGTRLYSIDLTFKEGQSALTLLQKETNKGSIITFSAEIDGMLGGGIPLGKLTEFCGVPGIGKTQMGIQLAVDVHIPKLFDGAEGHCIYIDTEGSFVVERVSEIAESVVKHLREMTKSSKNEQEKEAAARFSAEEILSNIYYYRVHDYVEQIALVNVLPSILHERPQVKLIVMDSVTFHFRHDFEDMSLRTRILNSMAQKLTAIAEQHSLAVVLVNQMTTKVNKDSDSQLVPALGETWGHCCNNRIILYWNAGQRLAHLYKSPQKKAATVPYHITADGVR